MNLRRSILDAITPDKCDHPNITISGVRDDLSPVYQCDKCGSVVRPWELDRKYVFDPTE